MSSIISSIHSVLAYLFEVVWIPVGILSPTWALVVSSSVFGIIMVWAYGYVSNQSAIKAVKNDITSYILETFLFRYDTRLSLRAQGRLFLSGIRYFALALAPIALLAIPCVFLLAHLNLRLGYRPLQPGEARLMKVQVAESIPIESMKVTSEGVQISGPVRTPRDRSAFFRVQGTESGEFNVILPGGMQEPVVVARLGSSETKPLGIFLSKKDWLSALFFPNGASSQKLPSADITEVQLMYPERMYSLLGAEMSWIVPFLVLSIVTGYVGSKFLGVAV